MRRVLLVLLLSPAILWGAAALWIDGPASRPFAAALALGFVTRVAAAANALVLAGAVVVALVGTTGEMSLLGDNVNFQFTLLVFFSLVLLTWRGAGPLSLDHLVRLDVDKEPEIL